MLDEFLTVFREYPFRFVYNTFMENGLRLTLRYRVLLSGIREAGEKGFELTPSGLVLLFQGKGESELPPALRGLSCYGYSPSKKGKAIKSALHLLHRHGYLLWRFEEGMKEPFVALSEKARTLPLPTLKKKEKPRREIVFRKIERNEK